MKFISPNHEGEKSLEFLLCLTCIQSNNKKLPWKTDTYPLIWYPEAEFLQAPMLTGDGIVVPLFVT